MNTLQDHKNKLPPQYLNYNTERLKELLSNFNQHPRYSQERNKINQRI